jgi:polyhydroxyalkanoate synthesis repressor PhaR
VADKAPITIKKYANRRLYNTGTSTYVTLEDLAQMVKVGEDFIVVDAKSGEDITRSVLTQIIFEQEGKGGQALLPITFLRQLIQFYGDSMQMLVPSYLEFTIDQLTGEKHKIRESMSAFGGKAMGGSEIFSALEEQTRQNMAMFTQALSMFNPFRVGMAADADHMKDASSTAQPENQSLDGLKKQLGDMQRQIDELSKRGS